MRSCKRLKNINSVSGKLRERQIDPLRSVATVGYRQFKGVSPGLQRLFVKDRRNREIEVPKGVNRKYQKACANPHVQKRDREQKQTQTCFNNTALTLHIKAAKQHW